MLGLSDVEIWQRRENMLGQDKKESNVSWNNNHTVKSHNNTVGIKMQTERYTLKI